MVPSPVWGLAGCHGIAQEMRALPLRCRVISSQRARPQSRQRTAFTSRTCPPDRSLSSYGPYDAVCEDDQRAVEIKGAYGNNGIAIRPTSHDHASALIVQETEETGEPQTPEFPIITPHDLRHTCASLAISAGANIKVLQTLMGHKTATLTLDRYGHLFPDDLGGIAERFRPGCCGLAADWLLIAGGPVRCETL